jgi:glyoxylase-like metal-dependent hydrolase (beta-lactamase superfamily II)
MTLLIKTFTLGPFQTNCYLLADSFSGKAFVIDAPSGAAQMTNEANAQGFSITDILITHAHFDHINGVSELIKALDKPVPVHLHPADLALWRQRGGSSIFGLFSEQQPDPTSELVNNQIIMLGDHKISVFHAPGHTPGHVIFYSPDAATAFTGDLIFHQGVGRTDLPGGNFTELTKSIKDRIFTLPLNTLLLSGHGAETTVENEKLGNPFFD